MAIPFRLKCPHCGEIMDVQAAQPCKKCNNMVEIPTDGCIQLYRMGSPMGVAVGMGIYVNGEPYGHLANKQSIRIPLNAGSYKLHVTHTTIRRCNDPVFEIAPGSGILHCCKAHIKMGFVKNSIVVEPAQLSEMPQD